jgi:hypothetical protein
VQLLLLLDPSQQQLLPPTTNEPTRLISLVETPAAAPLAMAPWLPWVAVRGVEAQRCRRSNEPTDDATTALACGYDGALLHFPVRGASLAVRYRREVLEWVCTESNGEGDWVGMVESEKRVRRDLKRAREDGGTRASSATVERLLAARK